MMSYEGEYVNYGAAGVKVSRIALGLGFRGQTDAKEAEQLILKAIDSGINLIDCGNIYTLGEQPEGIRSEKILGNALKGRRNNVVITSKVGSIMMKQNGPNEYGASRFHIMREIENSLNRLGTDHIDVYLLHDPDPTTPFEEQFRTMETLVQQGKIRYVGLCNHKVWQVATALAVQQRINAQPLITVQNSYSLLNRTLEDEMFPLVRYHGLAIMAYSLLGIGLLSGVYSPDSKPGENRFWGRHPLFREYYRDVFQGQVTEVVETIRVIASENGATMSQVAVAWVLSKPEITVAISGANTEVQLQDMIKASSLSLQPDELKRLDFVSDGLRMSLMNYDLKKYRDRTLQSENNRR
jgi:aryl-alcohol dehydrogenase-like predicted oxidoreductase